MVAPRIDPRHRSLVFREIYKRLFSDRMPSNAKIVEELTELVSEHIVDRRYTFDQVHCAHIIDGILSRGMVSPSSVDVFWIPISQAFESLSDFLQFSRVL